MSRRVLVRAISFFALALILSLAVNIRNLKKVKRYEQVISDNYYYALSEVLAGMTKIDYALEKCAYSGDSSMIASLCGEVFCQSEGTTSALSMLPTTKLSLENTAEFISKTGDFAYCLLKKSARGEKITEDEKESLKRLSQGASDIVVELHRISGRLERDNIDIANVDYTKSDDETIMDIKELEREFAEYPVLVYDGPFSDETEGASEYLSTLQLADENTLIKSAAEFLGAKEETIKKVGDWYDGEIKLVSFTDGKKYVDLTARGALVYKCISEEPLEEKSMTVEEGLLAAGNFLSENGFSDLSETYHMAYDNLLVINFAPRKEGVTVYPDLVKVSVSLADGGVVNFDAAGYVKNHKKREIRDVSKAESAARERVSEKLKILSYSPAIIPRDGAGEVLAHEFKCETENGEHLIVYINADTLVEERILVLVEDENGTLAM